MGVLSLITGSFGGRHRRAVVAAFREGSHGSPTGFRERSRGLHGGITAALFGAVFGVSVLAGTVVASETPAVLPPPPPDVDISSSATELPSAEPAVPVDDAVAPEPQPSQPEDMPDEGVPSASEDMPSPDALEAMSDEAFEALLLGALAPLAKPESAAASPGFSDELPSDLAELLDADDDAPAASTPVQLHFNFRFQPWEDVLDWFAEQAGYSLVMDAPPSGTFNYIDARSYTPAEAIDLLNSVLLTKGYTLVLRDRMLVLVNLDDGVPPNLVATVSAEELDKRGEYELVSSLFELENLTAEEVQKEIESLIGPQGSVVVLPKARQVLVTETAGKLRTIRDVIRRADNPGEAGGEEVRWFDLQFASAEEVLTIFRQLFNIPVGQNAATDGSIRFAFDPLGMRLLVSGNAKKLEQVQKVLETIDVPGAEGSELAGAKSALQLEVYDVTPADPDAALKVVQTLLAGLPGVRLSTDPKTGGLIALARPEDHATIKATLSQMQRDATRMEVFRLRSLDPQLAILAISKLFSNEGTKAPSVDADLTSRQLLVRGRQAQIEQIRALLEKMGETGGDGEYAATGSGNVRMIPLSGQGVGAALERLQEVWPMLHGNPVRVVTPSAVIPTLRETSPAQPPVPNRGVIDQRLVNPPILPQNGEPVPQPATPGDLSVPPAATQPAPAQPSAGDRSTRNSSPVRPGGAKVFLASEPVNNAGPPSESQAEPPQPPETADPGAAPKSNAPIVLAMTPAGLMIASEDEEALNDFERLLGVLAGSVDSDSGPKATVFYLKHAKAQAVADILNRILASATTRTATTASTPPPGQPTQPGSSSNPAASGMLGYMLGTGGTPGGISLTGPVLITADTRLNALVVQANPADVDTVEQILQVLDQKESPEDILAQPKPRLIPVYNTQASEVAEIVKQVYQDRMITGAGGGSSGGRPSNPMEFFQMMRGSRDGRDGRDGRSGSPSSGSDSVERMSIGVDERTNSVIVCAPDLLYQEVKQLVEQLDEAASQKQESVRVVTLHGVSAQAAQQALAALMGDQVQSSGSGRSSSRSSSSSSSRSSSDRGGSSDSSDWARRFQERMQFFRGSSGSSSGSPFGSSRSSRGSR